MLTLVEKGRESGMVDKGTRYERDGAHAGSVIGEVEGALRTAMRREQRGIHDGC